MKTFNKCIGCLAIELTRRCNMNCVICGRGSAQNIDISKEIIDKTFNEMENVYIDSLRIHGGEPFLSPDMMIYLINKIIDKHISLNNVCIYTNGTKVQPELVEPFKKLLKYLADVESELKHIIRWYNNHRAKVYSRTFSSKFDIIISEYEHSSTSNEINNFIEFYRQIDDDDLSIVRQTNEFDDIGNVTIEGKAVENYKQLIGDSISLDRIRILNNDYAFVEKYINTGDYGVKSPLELNGLLITKTLTISANGNVFPGCIMSYDRVDEKPMFNILSCNEDFFAKVVSFCWEYPINSKTRNIRNKFLAINFCQHHNVKVKYMTPTDYALIKMLNVFAEKHESIARDMHSMLPCLWFNEIDAITTAALVLNMFEQEVPLNIIKDYLTYCTEFDSETIKNISAEWCRGFIIFISEKDRKRREKEENT